MVALNIGGPMLVIGVFGGGFFLIGIIIYGYYKYQLELAKHGGRTADKESVLDKKEADLEGKKMIAARGDVALTGQELRNEAFLIREEMQKLDLCKLLAERANIIERIGFNAIDPRWQQVPILSSTMGILHQLQQLISAEIGQTKQLLGINEKKTKIDSIQKRIDASQLRLEKKMEGMEKLELKAEAIEIKKVGKELKRIVEMAKFYEKKALDLIRKHEKLLKKDAQEERIKLNIEKREHQLIEQFEKQQNIALNELKRIYGILQNPGNRSTNEVVRELKRLMGIFRGAENILTKAFRLHRDEIKIFAKILGERVLVEREQLLIEQFLTKRDNCMQQIAMKERKTQIAKEWAIAKQKGQSVSVETQQILNQDKIQRDKLKAEIAAATKEMEESDALAGGFAALENAIR